ncbi:EamA family transporter [Methylocaldum szegediense]|uniref:Bacterial/archaeal transporter family protein n=1 Tax=Methylocaldum szegediense TaxID=73780 RepID=A0ABN8X7M6_9GAMM|nr:DMT family transporter [Methylocaldum szegediense]CAI8875169.1 bacterial/archaeal transporter family protein [Methylocaldum szegediense]
MSHWVLYAAVAFVCWGLWAFLPKLTTRYIDPKSAIIYEAVGSLVVGLVVLALVAFKPAAEPRGILLALSTGVLGAMGAFAFLHAVTKGPVTLVSTGTALYPILAIVLACCFLNESVTLRQGVGIVLALIAVALISA